MNFKDFNINIVNVIKENGEYTFDFSDLFKPKKQNLIFFKFCIKLYL